MKLSSTGMSIPLTSEGSEVRPTLSYQRTSDWESFILMLKKQSSAKQPFSATDTTSSHTSVPVCTGPINLCMYCTMIHIQHAACIVCTDLSTLCNNTHIQ